MKKLFTLVLLSALSLLHSQERATVITYDIDNFWQAYDKIVATNNPEEQHHYLKTLFLDKGTPGLEEIIEARNYTAQEYLDAIKNYHKFWQSVRPNTYKAKDFAKEIEAGVVKLKDLYPELKPAPVYFTIGAMRTGGTARNGIVLIGSEMALTDKNTVSSEISGALGAGRRVYFDSNPIDDVVMLNIHEYVHTQQKDIVHNLLSEVIYEGVAEFVSVKAMGQPSSTPAVHFGKKNPGVKKKFEEEMFNYRTQGKWLWSDVRNEFNMRDLGYYVGYALCEKYYNEAADKKAAIKKMIELDYTNEAEIEAFVDGTKFFSAPLEELYRRYEASRPVVAKVSGIENGSTTVKPGLTTVTVTFSEPMDRNSRNFDYGPLGENNVLAIQRLIGYSDDGKSISFEVDLQPGRHYQMTVASGFRNVKDTPLKPYLIDITTTK
jgi:hypothetical protein